MTRGLVTPQARFSSRCATFRPCDLLIATLMIGSRLVYVTVIDLLSSRGYNMGETSW